MNIIAIWDRSRTAPESKAIFCLLSDGRFIKIEPEEASGDPKWNKFGGPQRYDFRRAHFIISHLGGFLLWIESLDADVEKIRRQGQ